MKPHRVRLTLVFMALLITLTGGAYAAGSGRMPFVARLEVWSIGLYTGPSPFQLTAAPEITNPVLTAHDVTDVPADFVADPFMLVEDQTWYMFFEVLNSHNQQGDIGLASSADGWHWRYRQIVLDEPFHLSYPYVFNWSGEHYMLPETLAARSVRLYRASNFPTRWEYVATLIQGEYVDPSIIRYGEHWWLFAGSNPGQNDTLHLFYATGLTGPWVEHPASPLVQGDANIARPGGRLVIFDERLIRFAQDDAPTYGNQLHAFEIIELTPAGYQEREVATGPVLKASGQGWNASGMHQLDPYPLTATRWLACVDGYREKIVFGFGY